MKRTTSVVLMGVLCIVCTVTAFTAERSNFETQCSAQSQLTCYCDDQGMGKNAIALPDNPVAPCYASGYQTATFLLFGWFSAFSWSAINWPVDIESGLPDYSKDLKTVDGDNAAVWEYWKTTSDVFLPDGSEPAIWTDKVHTLPASCRAIDLEAARSGYDASFAASVPDVPPRLLTDYVNAEGDIVVDRNGELLRFETVMNQTAFDYILEHELYNAEGQQAFFDHGGKVNFPVGLANGKTRGSYFLKAAWKVLGQKETYDDVHKAWAYVYPTFKNGRLVSKCELRPVGLLGLHVTYKLTTAPQWAWATFEHVRNAPTWNNVKKEPNAEPKQRNDYFLFNRDCIASKDCVSINTAPQLFPHGGKSPLPSQLVMQQDYGYGYSCPNPGDCSKQDVNYINDQFEKLLASSVWKNYRLKGTQWVDPRDQNRIKPVVLANSSIEPYIQATSSCLECHMSATARYLADNGQPIPNAKKSDNIFVLQKAKPKMFKLGTGSN